MKNLNKMKSANEKMKLRLNKASSKRKKFVQRKYRILEKRKIKE